MTAEAGEETACAVADGTQPLADFPAFYVADTDNHRVLRFEPGLPEGRIVAGGAGAGSELHQLDSPVGIAVDRDGCMLIVDCANDRVLHYPRDEGADGPREGVVVAGGGGAGSGLAQLDAPCGLAVDRHGTIYIGDCFNHRVVAWERGAKEGKLVAGGSRGDSLEQLSSPNGVAVGVDGSIFVADFENNRIVRWATGARIGTVAAGGNGPGPGREQLDGPCGVCVASDGHVAVSERGPKVSDYRVSCWRSGAKEGVAVAGSRGCGEEVDQLNMPWGVVQTPDRGFLVVDAGNHRVVYWAPGAMAGIVVAGGNGRGRRLDQLKSPCGIALAPR